MGPESLFSTPPILNIPAGKSMTPPVPVPEDYTEQIDAALREDVGSGDLTASLIPPGAPAHASIITRENAVICGIPYVEGTFARLDAAVRIDWRVDEGAHVAANQMLCRISGPARALLTGERTALNFLQLLSATATATHAYVLRLKGTACRLLDTRKTLPGLRTAQKYAVRVGGGLNHRIGLYDGILIKENHIMAAGGIALAYAPREPRRRRCPWKSRWRASRSCARRSTPERTSPCWMSSRSRPWPKRWPSTAARSGP